jgi:hypothetical protein
VATNCSKAIQASVSYRASSPLGEKSPGYPVPCPWPASLHAFRRAERETYDGSKHQIGPTPLRAHGAFGVVYSALESFQH